MTNFWGLWIKNIKTYDLRKNEVAQALPKRKDCFWTSKKDLCSVSGLNLMEVRANCKNWPICSELTIYRT
jgi:hypothetical protein